MARPDFEKIRVELFWLPLFFQDGKENCGRCATMVKF